MYKEDVLFQKDLQTDIRELKGDVKDMKRLNLKLIREIRILRNEIIRLRKDIKAGDVKKDGC